MKKSILICTGLVLWTAWAQAGLNSRVINAQKPLTLPLPSELNKQQIVHIRCFLQQNDPWSCGYRAVFHAIALEKALKSPDKFQEHLKHNLQNTQLLQQVYDSYGYNKGLSNTEMEKIARKFSLDDRALMFVTVGQAEITLLGEVTFTTRGPITEAEKKQIVRKKQAQKLHESLQHFIDQKNNTPRAFHIIAGINDHWILFSIIRSPGKAAQLYIIDSNNKQIGPAQNVMISFLKHYLVKI